jgi:hypothetical protein
MGALWAQRSDAPSGRTPRKHGELFTPTPPRCASRAASPRPSRSSRRGQRGCASGSARPRSRAGLPMPPRTQRRARRCARAFLWNSVMCMFACACVACCVCCALRARTCWQAWCSCALLPTPRHWPSLLSPTTPHPAVRAPRAPYVRAAVLRRAPRHVAPVSTAAWAPIPKPAERGWGPGCRGDDRSVDRRRGAPVDGRAAEHSGGLPARRCRE